MNLKQFLLFIMIISNSGKTYILTSKLGKGAFGNVSICVETKTGIEFAYKKNSHIARSVSWPTLPQVP